MKIIVHPLAWVALILTQLIGQEGTHRLVRGTLVHIGKEIEQRQERVARSAIF